ncbi:MAG: dephospho-CoA kinase [Ruminococcaceae bacterium]|nr:dephospho-CoA kinase [Oscillospiraceae bacterium]
MIIGLTGPTGAGKGTVASVFAAHGFMVLDMDQIAHGIYEDGGECVREVERAFPGVTQNGVLNRRALADLVFADEKKLELLNHITHKYIIAQTKEYIARANHPLAQEKEFLVQANQPFEQATHSFLQANQTLVQEKEYLAQANQTPEQATHSLAQANQPPEQATHSPAQANQTLVQTKENLYITKNHPILLDAPLLFEAGMESMCDATVCVLADENARMERIMARDGMDESHALARMKSQHPDAWYEEKSDYCIVNNTTPQALLERTEEVIARLTEELC